MEQLYQLYLNQNTTQTKEEYMEIKEILIWIIMIKSFTTFGNPDSFRNLSLNKEDLFMILTGFSLWRMLTIE